MNFNPLIGATNTCLADKGVVTISCIPGMFVGIITLLLIFSGIIAVLFIIFGGIKFITSQGDEKTVDGAKKTITWAIIGLVLILLSFAILRFVAQITGVSCINRFGFDQCKINRQFTQPQSDDDRDNNDTINIDTNATCDPATENRICPSGKCVCVPKSQAEICNRKGEKTICNPTDPTDCDCVPKDWPTCRFIISNCGPGYECNTSQKQCVIKP